VTFQSNRRGETLSILIPHQGNFERRECRKSERGTLIGWFQEVESQAWVRLAMQFPKEDPKEIFLIVGQTMTSECWISHIPSNASCSIWLENLVHRLPLPTTESVWIGDDLFEVKAMQGFQKYEGGSRLRTIFLERSASCRLASHRSKSAQSTTAPILGLALVFSPDRDQREPIGDFDIIFVHGLGGSARSTWTHPRTKWFWPQNLYVKKGFQKARVLTFGYNSDWANVFGPSNKLDLHDFSLQLLNRIDLYHREHGAV
jgi:hypothetical protein